MNASNVVLLEHINLNLSRGRLPEARRLFLDACGFVEDPRPSERGRIDSLLWVNCGLQQVHLPIDPSTEGAHSTPPCQIIDGELHFAIENGTAVKFLAQLRQAGIRQAVIMSAPPGCLVLPGDGLGNTYVFSEETQIDTDAIKEAGNELLLPNATGCEPDASTRDRHIQGTHKHSSKARVRLIGGLSTALGQPGFSREERLRGSRISDETEAVRGPGAIPCGLGEECTAAPVHAAVADASVSASVSASSSALASAQVIRPFGLRGVELNVPDSQLHEVSAFWTDIMGARVELSDRVARAWFDGASPELRGCQRIVFRGVDRARQPYDGHHLAVYVGDFKATFDRAASAGLVFDNPRFSDRGGTWELACLHHQFRTLLMRSATGPERDRDLDPFQLELEIRSLTHPACPL